MELIRKISAFKFLFFSFMGILSILNPKVSGQNVSSGNVMKSANDIAAGINKISDDAKAKYAENIDNPYIPVRINPEYTPESAKESLTKVLKKYVNYYYASKVPAYKNLSTMLTIRNIKNGAVTDDYIRFTSAGDNDFKDTVTIYYKDILNYQINYYVKITDGGFYMPYVKVKDHLLTCGGKETADLLFFMQHKYALRCYEQDLADFKLLANKYQALAEKPTITAEQRRLIVQGNLMNEKLNYGDAIVYYDKAMALDPLSYPAGYYNFALISALAERYELAILNMNKYLLLMPDAADAQAAQDKIYEWEALITKN
jgi:tetratricopeptide (TPR) repeat protein